MRPRRPARPAHHLRQPGTGRRIVLVWELGCLTGGDHDAVRDLVGEGLPFGAVPQGEQPTEVAGGAVDEVRERAEEGFPRAEGSPMVRVGGAARCWRQCVPVRSGNEPGRTAATGRRRRIEGATLIPTPEPMPPHDPSYNRGPARPSTPHPRTRATGSGSPHWCSASWRSSPRSQ